MSDTKFITKFIVHQGKHGHYKRFFDDKESADVLCRYMNNTTQNVWEIEERKYKSNGGR